MKVLNGKKGLMLVALTMAVMLGAYSLLPFISNLYVAYTDTVWPPIDFTVWSINGVDDWTEEITLDGITVYYKDAPEIRGGDNVIFYKTHTNLANNPVEYIMVLFIIGSKPSYWEDLGVGDWTFTYGTDIVEAMWAPEDGSWTYPDGTRRSICPCAIRNTPVELDDGTLPAIVILYDGYFTEDDVAYGWHLYAPYGYDKEAFRNAYNSDPGRFYIQYEDPIYPVTTDYVILSAPRTVFLEDYTRSGYSKVTFSESFAPGADLCFIWFCVEKGTTLGEIVGIVEAGPEW